MYPASGSDLADGTKSEPFKTINRAASLAVAGDTVRVFGGTYREWVDPKNGGSSDHNRIIYEAVEGDWLIEPVSDYRVHLGDVYINGVSMFEAKSMDDLYDPTPRIKCCQNSWRVEDELHRVNFMK